MRYLGIDYGGKRVGLSLSDGSGALAIPLSVVPNNEDLLNEVLKICKEKDVKEIVIGESLNFAQKENEIMKEIKPFALKLTEAHFPTHFHPEFMTSEQAEQIQGKNDMHDASAASLILQSYLDTINNKNDN